MWSKSPAHSKLLLLSLTFMFNMCTYIVANKTISACSSTWKCRKFCCDKFQGSHFNWHHCAHRWPPARRGAPWRIAGIALQGFASSCAFFLSGVSCTGREWEACFCPYGESKKQTVVTREFMFSKMICLWAYVFQTDRILSYIICVLGHAISCYICMCVCERARAWSRMCAVLKDGLFYFFWWCVVRCGACTVYRHPSPQTSSSKAPQRLLLLWKLGELAIAQLWTSRKLTKLRAHRPIHTSPGQTSTERSTLWWTNIAIENGHL